VLQVCENRGAPVQIHHIDDDPGNNDPANLAVLCLICHRETQISGGFARNLSPAEDRLCRDQWVQRVAKRRRDGDALVVRTAFFRLDVPFLFLGVGKVTATREQVSASA
jgi:hypothetical protein